MRWSRVMLLGLIVLLYLGSPMSCGALARETWSEIGHIQILEGPEKIWVFIEVVRITDYTDELFLHLMSKHPDTEIVSQSVFTLDRLGNVTQTPIAKGTGPNLDPDLHPIFRLADGFYQYDGGSMGRPASVYRWRGDRFSPLDERESKEAKQRIRRVEPADRLTDVLLELEAITEREGWRNLYLHAVDAFSRREGRQDLRRGDAHRPTEPADPFVSDKHQIKISVRESDALPGWRKLRRSSVLASSLSKSKPWSQTLVKVDTSGKRGRQASRGDGERVTNEPDETVFLGTVARIDNLGHTPDPFLRYVVTLKMDKVIRGRLPMDTFQLAIHSPSREGVELGHRYRISVRRSGAGYVYCGPHPRASRSARPAGAEMKCFKRIRSSIVGADSRARDDVGTWKG
jgi:hypothetical protein